MAELSDIVTLTTISSTRANLWQSRLIQRYSSVANRTTEHPSPSEGDLSYLEDVNAVEVYDGSGWVRVGPPAGAIEAFGGSSAPSGWLLCDGTAVSRTTYAALFSVIGETWGAGNGSSTFNVPDMRGRYPRGVAASGTGNTLAASFGADTLPNHAHTVDPPNTASGQGSFTGEPTDPPPGTSSGGQDHTHAVDIAQFNSGNPTATPAILPASKAVNFIIKT